jgi:hypothetical protein
MVVAVALGHRIFGCALSRRVGEPTPLSWCPGDRRTLGVVRSRGTPSESLGQAQARGRAVRAAELEEDFEARDFQGAWRRATV